MKDSPIILDSLASGRIKMLTLVHRGRSCIKFIIGLLVCLPFLLVGLVSYKPEPKFEQLTSRRVIGSQDKIAETINKHFMTELSYLRNFDDYCDELAIQNHTEFTPKFQREFKRFNDQLELVMRLVNNPPLAGHIGLFKNQQLVTALLVQLPFVRTVCETGFNAGHSTLVYLVSNPDVHVYNFDLGNHEYSQYMADYLGNRFRNR